MGTWGYKINQNDIYSDVKQYYISYLQLGKSNIEATKMLMDKFHCILVNEDDAPLFLDGIGTNSVAKRKTTG